MGGKIICVFSHDGTWELKGDTLVESINLNSYGWSKDVSRIQLNGIMSDLYDPVYSPNIPSKDFVKRWDLAKKGHVIKSIFRIDDSDNKMEVTSLENNSKTGFVYYLKRNN